MTLKNILVLSLVLVLVGCASSSSTLSTSATAREDMNPRLRSRLDLAAEYLRKGNHLGARDHLSKALDIDASEPQIYDLLALMYYKELEYELAEKNYRKAISVDPGFTRGYNNLGSFLYSRQRYKEACRYLERAGEDVDYVLRANVFYKLGLCKVQLADAEGAAQAFRKSLALNGRQAEPYLELAYLSFQQGNNQEAAQYLGAHNQLREQPSARGLWLGVRLDHLTGDLDARDSQGLALKKLFPDSREAEAYRQWRLNGYRSDS
ncbi:MAG: type IV pilus biogenesis/stability protein PilW [bacterium]